VEEKERTADAPEERSEATPQVTLPREVVRLCEEFLARQPRPRDG
jgi:hypothetical protein